MGKRGPKRADVNLLQADATAWASLFYTLRDGQSGSMQRVKWGAWRNTGQEKRTVFQSGRYMELPAHVKYRTFKPLGPPVLIPWSDAASLLPPKMEVKDWLISRPVMPEPGIWTLLKRARTVRQIKQAASRIRDFMTREYGEGIGRWLPGYPSVEIPDVLDQCAEDLLIGKSLPSYAKTDRPTSDDKRVEFLSKILAGARYGLAPITSIKRLAHWHLPRDWAEKSLKQSIERSQKEFAGHRVS